MITFIEYLVALSLLVELKIGELFEANSIAYSIYVIYFFMYLINLLQNIFMMLGKLVEIIVMSFYALVLRVISDESHLKVLTISILPNIAINISMFYVYSQFTFT